MGGIRRIIHKDRPNPDLLKSRLEEQKKREQKGEDKKVFKPHRLSKLQKIIIDLCKNNPPSYDATFDQILDAHFGKNTPATFARMSTLWRSIRNLKKKGYVELMPHRVRRVKLSETAQKIIKK